MAPIAYTLTDEEFEALRFKLATMPREDWPSQVDYDAIVLSARLASMERAEQEDKP